MKPQTVLIVSDNPAFARELVSRWQEENSPPAFTMVASDLWRSNGHLASDLIIIGEMEQAKAEAVARAIDSAGIRAIAVLAPQADLESWRAALPGITVIRRAEQWTDFVVLLGGEVLHRLDASSRAKRADHAMNLTLRHAALGKYMLESRHSFNNALTSVLGNAELMLLDATGLPEHLKEQVDTIHSMALRLHEMMQRFSSLEQEMTFGQGESQFENDRRAQAYVSGT